MEKEIEHALAALTAGCGATHVIHLTLKEVIERMGLIPPSIVHGLPLDRCQTVVGDLPISSNHKDDLGGRLVALWHLNNRLYDEMMELLGEIRDRTVEKELLAH